MRKDRKKIKDTKVGVWLRDKAPAVLDTVGDLLPDSGGLGVVKRLIDMEPNMSSEDKLNFNKLLMDYESNAQNNVTERWKADMLSDSWISKNIRPLMLIYLVVMFSIFVLLDSVDSVSFEVKDAYIDVLSVLMTTAFTAYFAGRSYEKIKLSGR
jgi:hypothetical protein